MYCWNDERNNFERLNEGLHSSRKSNQCFSSFPTFLIWNQNCWPLCSPKTHDDLAYIVENLSKKKTNQALFDYVGKNTKYIVICAAADWTKYSSVIIFVNFFFSFEGPIIYFIKDRIPSRHKQRNNALYRIFSAKMGFALLFHQTTSKNIRPPRHMKIEMKKFFFSRCLSFFKKTQKDRGSRKRDGWKYRYQKYIHSHCQK